MENLWIKAHRFILDSRVGDFYMRGEDKVYVVRRTPKRIYFSSGESVTIKFSNRVGYFSGGTVNQILRDIEGYFIYLNHDLLHF